MTEVPKIVHHRLRAVTPAREVLEQTHPDADVLTAFAEQALAAREREGVLQHLALCADCRDIVALALPEFDTVTPPVEEEKPNENEINAAALSLQQDQLPRASPERTILPFTSFSFVQS